MKAVIDTCVVVDFLQDRKPFSDAANAVFVAAASDSFDAYITANSVSDIYYLLSRSLHDDRKCHKVISDLFELVGILDATSLDCKKALLSKMTDYEDALLDEIAERSGMDFIITWNIKDFSGSQVRALDSEEFLALLND